MGEREGGKVPLGIHGNHGHADADGLLEDRLRKDRLAGSGRPEDHRVAEEVFLGQPKGFARVRVHSEMKGDGTISGGTQRRVRNAAGI
jgi:hypothetical protein